MSNSLAKQFVTEGFNPEKFVKDLSSHCIGAEELRQERVKIQELASSTSALLKRNVYQNYIQFIETAKEISHLESEMYQLSQLLSEQRSTLNILGCKRNVGMLFEEDNSECKSEDSLGFQQKEEECKQKLIKLLENVEGAMNLVETPGRICLHEGSLLEIDPLGGTPIKRIHAYLFNDILMIASWLTNGNRRGAPRYKMQVVYELQSLAVINVRDLGTVKFAFKLLAFPDTRVFQCSTATSKKEWLEKCDQAKKLINSNQKGKIEVKDNDNEKVFKEEPQLSITQSFESNTTENAAELRESLPEWILEVMEDLDSYIAQRHFEEAYNLITKTRNFLSTAPMTSELNDIKLKLNNRINFLVNVLTKELELSAEAKSLQGGGLRSARRAVRLLIQLNRSVQACQLYLRLCSTALKMQMKRVKREGATIPYIKRLSAIAFSNIVEMSQEFLKLFPKSTNCNSALVVWCSHEVKVLTSSLIKQMFIPQVSLNTLAECIITIRDHCEQLSQIGMDFRYQLDSQLRAPLIKVLQDIREKYVDVVRIRASETIWKPSNFQTAENLQKMLSELDDLGIPLPEAYLKPNQYWIPLTNNTLIFSKLYIGLLEDCLNVTTPEIVNVVEEVLISVLKIQVQHLQSSLTNSKQQEKQLVQDNAAYVHNVIIARILELHRSVTSHQFSKLLALQEQLCTDLTSTSNKPKPASRTSVPKYSISEYI